MRPALVALFGAGASQAVGMPGTAELTELAATTPDPTVDFDGQTIAPFAAVLYKALSGYYDAPDFETMLHAIETLHTIRHSPPGAQILDAFKPVVSAFMDPSPRWRCLTHHHEPGYAAATILRRIATYLAYSQSRVSDEAKDGLRAVIDPLTSEYQLIIANLNYDTIIDDLVPYAADGFTDQTSDGMRFAYESLMGAGVGLQTMNLHLHGSLRYALHSDDSTIRKFESIETASVRWGALYQQPSQSGEIMIVGPLISGLRKAEKTLIPPFAQYNHVFVEMLLRHPRLLLVGYGGREAYLSNWLFE